MPPHHQLFKKVVPLAPLFDLLDKICNKGLDYYIIDENVYKKMLYNEYDKGFLAEILPYYHKSKQYFVTREFTYSSFANVIRQICHANDYEIIGTKQYNHSTYSIRYIINKV
jgi:hypothetical protein